MAICCVVLGCSSLPLLVSLLPVRRGRQNLVLPYGPAISAAAGASPAVALLPFLLFIHAIP
jgi:hypothetical protein